VLTLAHAADSALICRNPVWLIVACRCKARLTTALSELDATIAVLTPEGR
jgi:hypothetical protein